MADIEQYRKKVGELASKKGDDAGGTSTDTYQLARDQEYTALLDKEVQLENAKQNAMKYTNNQLASQGLDSTGYGSTQQSAIYGQYMNALGSAQNTAQSNVSNINLQESEANETAANDRFKSITTMLSSATSKDQMDSLLRDYGYMDENGEWLTKKPDGVSDDDWYQMRYYYNLQKDTLGEDDFNGTYYNGTDGLSEGTYLKSDGSTASIGSNFGNEVSLLSAKVSAGDVPYGSVICVANGHGETIYVMYTKKGFRMSTQDAFEQQDGSKQKFVFAGTGGSTVARWASNREEMEKIIGK